MIFIKQSFSASFKLVIINKDKGYGNFQKQTFPSLHEIHRGRDIEMSSVMHTNRLLSFFHVVSHNARKLNLLFAGAK